MNLTGMGRDQLLELLARLRAEHTVLRVALEQIANEPDDTDGDTAREIAAGALRAVAP
jgi:hypothetical protein